MCNFTLRKRSVAEFAVPVALCKRNEVKFALPVTLRKRSEAEFAVPVLYGKRNFTPYGLEGNVICALPQPTQFMTINHIINI